MTYSKIKKQKVYELIIEEIKKLLEDGRLAPGDKLPPERELATLFSVSRGAVREAMSFLEARGFIEVKPGIGNFLIPNTRAEVIQMFDSIVNEKDVLLIELLELRQSIEGQAAYYAAERRTATDLEKIKSALKRLEQSVKSDEVAAEEDFEFHFSVIRASHNSMMVHTLQLVSDACLKGVYEAQMGAIQIPGKRQQVMEEHYEIYHAIRDSNPERARRAVIDHLENVKKQLKLKK